MVIGVGPAGTAGLSVPDEGAALPSTGFAAPGPSLEVSEGPAVLPVLPMPPMMNSIVGMAFRSEPVVAFIDLAVMSCSAAMSCRRV